MISVKITRVIKQRIQGRPQSGKRMGGLKHQINLIRENYSHCKKENEFNSRLVNRKNCNFKEVFKENNQNGAERKNN